MNYKLVDSVLLLHSYDVLDFVKTWHLIGYNLYDIIQSTAPYTTIINMTEVCWTFIVDDFINLCSIRLSN